MLPLAGTPSPNLCISGSFFALRSLLQHYPSETVPDHPKQPPGLSTGAAGGGPAPPGVSGNVRVQFQCHHDQGVLLRSRVPGPRLCQARDGLTPKATSAPQKHGCTRHSENANCARVGVLPCPRLNPQHRRRGSAQGRLSERSCGVTGKGGPGKGGKVTLQDRKFTPRAERPLPSSAQTCLPGDGDCGANQAVQTTGKSAQCSVTTSSSSKPEKGRMCIHTCNRTTLVYT